MGGFRSFGEFGEAAEAGQIHTAHLRKVPSQASAAGQWVDLSMAAGNPVPNYYASSPLEAAVLNGQRGIFHGDAKAPATKYVVDVTLCGISINYVGTFELLDYLLYYPFVDLDDTNPQVLTNDVSLPRYTDGEGVRAMLVAQAPSFGAAGSFTYDYINQDGNARTSPTITCNTTSDAIATIVTSQQGTASRGILFLPMANGDTGIRSVTGVTMLAPNGGLGALVLVKPILTTMIQESSVPSEVSFLNERPSAPVVKDGAYLGFVTNCAGSINTALLVGRITFVWK